MKCFQLEIQCQLYVILFFILFCHQNYAYQVANSLAVFKWRVVDFDFPSEQARRDAIRRGQYVPNNVLVLDADYHAPTRRYFVTTPPFVSGVPATLSEVIKDSNEVLLKPFPNWGDRVSEQCRKPQFVYRTHIDKCGLMWVLDTGLSDCPPKLLIYDLNNGDREILRYDFPKGVYTNCTQFINIVTESRQNDCRDSIAYIADVRDHALVVFDLNRRNSWRIENKLFYPFPSEGTVTLSGVTFDLMDGIFGLALGSASDRDRKLYFHSFASVRESWVPISVLKNQTMAKNPAVLRTAIVTSEGKRAGQSTVQVMTEDGILIYALIPMNAIACWNSRNPFTIEHQHILEKNNEDFQFISGMKLKNNQLLITSCRFQNFMNGNINGTEFKYRVMVINDVKRMLQNSPCRKGFSGGFGEEGFTGGVEDSDYFGEFSNVASPGSASHNGPYGGSSNSGPSTSFSNLNSGPYGGFTNNGLSGHSGCRNGICDKTYSSTQSAIIYKTKSNSAGRGYLVKEDAEVNFVPKKFQNASESTTTEGPIKFKSEPKESQFISRASSTNNQTDNH